LVTLLQKIQLMKHFYALPIALLFYVIVSAQAGSLDNSFSGNGKVITGFGYGNDYGNSVAIQADGKIVVAGTVEGQRNPLFGLARYNKNGTLDNTFSGNGRVTTSFGSSGCGANHVAIQADGKIVAVGFSGSNFAIARYNSNGSLDKTFGGGDGKVVTDFGGIGGNGEAYSVAIQSNGKIVVAGLTTASGGGLDFAIARYNTNGTLDNTFGGGDGKVVTDFGGNEEAYSVAIQSNGKIVVAGFTTASGGDNDFALARYNSNGTLDNTFSGNGLVITGFGGSDVCTSVAIQSDGKIVAGGYTNAGFALARYNTNGTLDKTFSTDGLVTTVIIGGVISAIAIQSDGKIIAAGGGARIDGDFALARYNKNGSLDNSFNSGGLVFTNFGGTDDASGVAIQSDGKIVLAGFTTASGGDYDFAVARYHGDVAFTAASADEQQSEDKTGNEVISAIRIYPNPVSDIIHIAGLNASSSSIIITDAAGNILQQQNILSTQHSINVSALRPGIYYLNVIKENTKVELVKFVKQ
jgi:uncharacterized delta-60 repeat protein